ncbi:hypothetical protein GZ212_12900 [Mangrovimonas sp. CR14]|uniref:SO2930 family diheme c-type cytochrome n=1 Tax=Mangrovimonas sp. CR14 TaxID=2706120 RepID=UPI00141E2886|nr:SO2930 family diheme c-type cytochrome [Mangrovimonas sp. CR14]NIK93055.1 hypothetical protein [Mangrovimonas sp. CR14]
MRLYLKYLFKGIMAMLLFACSTSDDYVEIPTTGVNIPSGTPFNTLSEYNFFIGDLKNLKPNTEAGIIPFDLNTPLFSDYALKKRFVYVPEGKTIAYNDTEVLNFPSGSVLIKNFYYQLDGEDYIIETRLLIKTAATWEPATYTWNDSQTEAYHSVVGGTKNITITIDDTQQTFNYSIPNENQCIICHGNNGKIEAIGPRIHNLNKDFNYGSNTENQITHWANQGILEPPTNTNIPSWPKFEDTTADLNERARAYLAVNCSSCHSAGGAANNSGLYLGYFNENPLSLGIYKTPVAAGSGSGGFTYVIEPGNASESILLYRMNSSELDIRMPEIGRELIHSEGVALIEEWINSL